MTKFQQLLAEFIQGNHLTTIEGEGNVVQEIIDAFDLGVLPCDPVQKYLWAKLSLLICHGLGIRFIERMDYLVDVHGDVKAYDTLVFSTISQIRTLKSIPPHEGN